MLTHTTLFTDVTKQLVRWFCTLPQNHTFDLQKTISAFPRCSRYAVELNEGQRAVRLVAYDDIDYPMGYLLDTITLRDKAQRFKEAATTANQVARLVGEGPTHPELSLQQQHVAHNLTDVLLRQVTDDHTLRIDIHTRYTGYRLGFTSTNRLGRVVINEGYDFTEDDADEPPSPVETHNTVALSGHSLFHYYHQKAKGKEHKVFYRDISSLEAVVYQGGRLSHFPGSWPLVAFTALSGGQSNDYPGLALKTPRGWLILLHGYGEGLRPYYCFALPDVYAQQYQIPKDRYVGEETVQLLLTAHRLQQACKS